MKSSLSLALVVLLYGLFSWLTNLPQDVGSDVPQGKLNSMSFAPYREGQGPMEKRFPSPEQIDEDLKLMGETTHTIRTYASSEGNMPVIPGLAGKYGLKMIQGAWLNAIPEDNKREINELIRSANANPDVVKRVMVGNEVLLRGDLKPEQIIEYIREVKRSVKQPVSYADVWSEYMKHPQLIKEVDFITIHILPYWEDKPITVDQAPEHIERIYKQVQKEAESIAPGKPILIGESGWPGEGKQRGGAIPGVVNEAKFIRELIKVANKNGFDYNIVEAFNQPWKSAFEGVVGANWGLYDVDREEVFPLTGSVHENPEWLKSTAIAVFILLVVVLFSRNQLNGLSTLKTFGYLLFIQTLAALLVDQAHILWYTSYSDWQRLQSVLLIGLNVLIGGLVTQRILALLSHASINPKLSQWLYASYIVFAGYAVYKTFGLAYQGRYLSFPIQTAAVPVVSILGLIATFLVNQDKHIGIDHLLGHQSPKRVQNTQLGILLLVMGGALIIGETSAFFISRDFIAEHPATTDRLSLSLLYTLGNAQLVQWLFSLLILALPLLSCKKTSA
ncbi:MAG: exo-beta-1,3-glucanase [Methylococcales bacterium]|nr:exo-beta-1,3-glucanase [Methylococcaceae bacterium]